MKSGIRDKGFASPKEQGFQAKFRLSSSIISSVCGYVDIKPIIMWKYDSNCQYVDEKLLPRAQLQFENNDENIESRGFFFSFFF